MFSLSHNRCSMRTAFSVARVCPVSLAALFSRLSLTRMRVAERHRLRSSVAPPTEILWGRLPYFLSQARLPPFKHRCKDLCRGKLRFRRFTFFSIQADAAKLDEFRSSPHCRQSGTFAADADRRPSRHRRPMLDRATAFRGRRSQRRRTNADHLRTSQRSLGRCECPVRHIRGHHPERWLLGTSGHTATGNAGILDP